MIKGRAWFFGDDIDTDVLAPGIHLKKDIPELAKHCLEAVTEDFASLVQPGDIIVAVYGFGIGSSREQAAQVLVELGVKAVVAKSFARIFYRNAINLGLPVLECESVVGQSRDSFHIDPSWHSIELNFIVFSQCAQPSEDKLQECFIK